MSDLSQCSSCGTRVEPTAEGYCPSCVNLFREAEEGQTDFGVQLNAASMSPILASRIKTHLVLWVFPAIALITSIALFLALIIFQELFLGEQQPAHGAISLVILILGVACGIGAAAKYWPKV